VGEIEIKFSLLLFFLVIVGILASLCTYRLIPRDPEVNNHLSL